MTEDKALLQLWLWAAMAVFGAGFILWLASLLLEDVSIVDSFWSLGFLLSTWVYVIKGPGLDNLAPPQWAHLALVSLWALRLSIHIAVRHHKAGQEDYRYRSMRERRGPSFRWWSLVGVFGFQCLLMMLIGLPLLVGQVARDTPDWQVTDFLFVALFAVGFFFEAVGDWQLARFKADPNQAGRVLSTGLWRYSRHPNYFGDAVIWWSFWIFALGSSIGIYTLLCPVVMTLFLLKVSGVSLLEKTIVDRRPKYRDYIERTPAFFPWFPKESAKGEAP